MATLAQQQAIPTVNELKEAEDTLFDVFVDALEQLTPEKRASALASLQANAASHAE
jgi:hypothetical protein